MVTATNGSAYGNATVSAAQNGSKVVITSASLDDSKNDGTLVTFYTTSDAEVTVEDASFESVKNNEISCYTSQQYDFYGNTAQLPNEQKYDIIDIWKDK